MLKQVDLPKQYPYYLYLHANGSLIMKSTFVVEYNSTPQSYFDSPSVIKWWHITLEKDLKEVEKYVEQYRKNLPNRVG